MFRKNNPRYKPLYKKFLKIRENIQKRKKILKFKKKKWENFIRNYKNQLSRYKIFKPRNSNRYTVSKYPNRYHSYKNRFKITLIETQKFSFCYGKLSKKYLKTKLNKHTNKSILLFLELFEQRLDVVLYRSKFFSSIQTARQMISHGGILINKKPIRIKSYIVKPGDLITINKKYLKQIKNNLIQSQIWPIPPKHLLINYKTMQILFGTIHSTNFTLDFNFNMEKILLNYIKH